MHAHYYVKNKRKLECQLQHYCVHKTDRKGKEEKRQKRGGDDLTFKSSSAMSSGSRLLPRGEHRGYSKTWMKLPPPSTSHDACWPCLVAWATSPPFSSVSFPEPGRPPVCAHPLVVFVLQVSATFYWCWTRVLGSQFLVPHPIVLQYYYWNCYWVVVLSKRY